MNPFPAHSACSLAVITMMDLDKNRTYTTLCGWKLSFFEEACHFLRHENAVALAMHDCFSTPPGEQGFPGKSVFDKRVLASPPSFTQWVEQSAWFHWDPSVSCGAQAGWKVLWLLCSHLSQWALWVLFYRGTWRTFCKLSYSVNMEKAK